MSRRRSSLASWAVNRDRRADAGALWPAALRHLPSVVEQRDPGTRPIGDVLLGNPLGGDGRSSRSVRGAEAASDDASSVHPPTPIVASRGRFNVYACFSISSEHESQKRDEEN